MRARLRLWRQKTSKTLDAVIIISLVILLVLLVLIILGYIFNWPWTGLHGRTLYDWLQLLIIPAVLAVGGYLFNYSTSRNEQKSTQLRDQTERDIAQDSQREAALQEYINKMSELLLDRKLRESTEDAEVRTIARVRTLTVLSGLDAGRKAIILEFLYESGLIDKNKPIIDLSRADFISAQLYAADLSEANLSGAFLNMANLSGANLSGANLSWASIGQASLNGADLSGADLSGASLIATSLFKTNLSKANLKDARGITVGEIEQQTKSLQGATMPDGSIHP